MVRLFKASIGSYESEIAEMSNRLMTKNANLSNTLRGTTQAHKRARGELAQQKSRLNIWQQYKNCVDGLLDEINETHTCRHCSNRFNLEVRETKDVRTLGFDIQCGACKGWV